MADHIDEAQAFTEAHRDRKLAAARAASRAIPAGEPGECHQCGEDMPRLVHGWCAPCRDARDGVRR